MNVEITHDGLGFDKEHTEVTVEQYFNNVFIYDYQTVVDLRGNTLRTRQCFCYCVTATEMVSHV